MYRLHSPFEKSPRILVQFCVESIREVETSSVGSWERSCLQLAVGCRRLPQFGVEADAEPVLEQSGAVLQPLGQAEERHLAEVGGGTAQEQATANGGRKCRRVVAAERLEVSQHARLAVVC